MCKRSILRVAAHPEEFRPLRVQPIRPSDGEGAPDGLLVLGLDVEHAVESPVVAAAPPRQPRYSRAWSGPRVLNGGATHVRFA
jgi:hypothetical protein